MDTTQTPAAPLDPEAEIGRLYGLPPERFTAARDDLVKRLRKAGAGDAAGLVRGLRRPTVAAWAVNRLAREQPGLVEELLEAGQRLAEAQEQALADGAGSALRQAATRRRRALDRTVAAAAGLLADSGRKPEPHLTGIAATLEAASVDERAATAVRQARLAAELSAPSGFGLLAAFTPAPARPGAPPEPAPRQRPAKPGPDTALARAERELAAATGAAAAAREAAGEREVDARAKARLARVAVRAVTRAERDAAKADRAAAEAEQAAAEAARRAEASRAEADDAEAAAETARAEAELARTEAEEAGTAAEHAREAASKAEAAAEKAARAVAGLRR